jgi:uncharacterized peroxidase-related enzyme
MRFTPLDPALARGKAGALLAAVKDSLGAVPNMTRHMANAPAVLEAYLAMNTALAVGTLGARLREQIALLTAQANGCAYCLSAHTFVGRRAGLPAADIASARAGHAADAREAAALRFASTVLDKRGHVDEAAVAAVRSAGFGDGAIGEIVGEVALNVFTNYFNSVTQPVVDFPPVALAKAA